MMLAPPIPTERFSFCISLSISLFSESSFYAKALVLLRIFRSRSYIVERTWRGGRQNRSGELIRCGGQVMAKRRGARNVP